MQLTTKSTHKLVATIISALLLSISSWVFAEEMDHSHHQQATTQIEQLIQAQGIVTAVDLKTNKVTISHDPIAELGWPAMAMRFTAQDSGLINHLKANDNVEFTFVQEGNLSVLRAISVIK